MTGFRPNTRRTALWLGVLAALLLTLGLMVGCGGSSATTTSTASGTVTTGGGSGGQTVQVVMTNRSYDPKDVTIKVGDTVTWINQDAPKHDVVADNGEFKSDLFDKGQSYSFTFDKAGTYPYHCSIHPGMEGLVIVK
jgi:amicyanin